MTAALIIVGVALLGAVVYLVRKATVLQTTAVTLQAQLQEFKEGKFKELIKGELNFLTTHAATQQKTATDATARIQRDLGAVAKQVEGLSELGKKVGELNDLLKPQQLRGELGEVIVKSLIADKLPPSQYEENYTFKNGKRVEFAIRLNDRLIPIDSKFQLDDFKRLREAPEDRRQALRAEFKRKVRSKIDEVKEYIRPEEGTFNFALMVIPSEAVFYELIANKDFVQESGLYEYARACNVFLVSPLTFWAYLTVIAKGLQGLEVGRRAEEIMASLETCATGVSGLLGGDFKILGDHLRNALSKYDTARTGLQDIDSDLRSLKRLRSDAATERSIPA